MTLWTRLFRTLRQSANSIPRSSVVRHVTISRQCLDEVQACIHRDLIRHHEGVCYLLGRIEQSKTILSAAIRPDAVTTPGSFHVDSLAMAAVMRSAAMRNLQVAGQLHTHPGEAYHSDGDERGARIRYSGYVSIVLPDYGRHLPTLAGAAIFHYYPGHGFLRVPMGHVEIVQEGWHG